MNDNILKQICDELGIKHYDYDFITFDKLFGFRAFKIGENI